MLGIGKKNRVKRGPMKLSRKVLLVLATFVLWGCAIVFFMSRTMFISRQFWLDVDECLSGDKVNITPNRGDILSDEGLLLASSVKRYRVTMDFKSSESDEKRRQRDQTKKDTLVSGHLDEFARQMHQLFPEYSESQLREYYSRGLKSRSRNWLLLPETSRNSYPISYSKYKMLAQTDLLKPKYEYWLYGSESKISREKPFGTLATRTIGAMYESKDSAKNGLELSYDSLLRGTPGIGHREKVQNIQHVVVEVPDIPGCDVWTTLNVDIQDITQQALLGELEYLNAESGRAVVMEVATGDIKSMASFNVTENGSYQEIQNNVAMEIYEPGSTFKTVSMMVAIDDGLVSLHDSVFCENGSYYGFGGAHMTDGSHGGVPGYGWLDVQHVLMNSCNIGTAKLINGAYGKNPKDFVDGVYETGINTHFDMQLKGTGKPVIRREGNWDATRLPWMAIGYNTQLPVINTLAFYNAIANDGCMVAPRLVTKVTRDGEIVEKVPVNVVRNHICKESTLKTIRFMLEQVVEGGTGKNAGSKYFKVAGKTGTAQLSKGASGYKSGRTTHMVSFVGYFPADNPKYSCIVSITTSSNTHMSAGGGSMAAPVFHEISERIMAMNSTRDINLALDTLHDKSPMVLSGDLARAAVVLDGLDLPYAKHGQWPDMGKNDSIWGQITLENGKYHAQTVEYTAGVVPDVRGMGAQDALYILEKGGLKVDMNGVGRVRSQSLLPGYKYRKGETIQIKLDLR